MYGYSEYIPLTTKNVLDRTTEIEIFKIVIKEEILTDGESYYSAPYRVDNHPNCIFRYYEGELNFTDWGSSPVNKDCFNFIKACFQLNNFQEVLELINQELELGLGDSIKNTKKVIKNRTEVKKQKKKNLNRTITILPRQFSYKDKKFWKKYEISKQNLIDDKIIPIKLYQSTNKQGEPFTVKPFDITYAYTDFEGDRKKIYRPNASNDRAKWFTNCTQNDVGGIRFLNRKSSQIVITKSYKDWRVLKNQGVNAVWFQNEGMIPSKDILIELVGGYTDIVVWFDNDNSGITKGNIIKQYINSILRVNRARQVFLPPALLQANIKDPSDLIFIKNRRTLLKFLDLNGVIYQKNNK